MAAKFLGLLLLCSLPLRHLRLTSAYGIRQHPVLHRLKLHTGIDLAARRDTAFCILDGMVTDCRYEPGLGLFVRVSHVDGIESLYGHLSQCLVLPGDSVRSGDALAITGATGLVTGEHLHFAVTFQHHYIDPLRFLQRMVILDTIKQHFIHE